MRLPLLSCGHGLYRSSIWAPEHQRVPRRDLTAPKTRWMCVFTFAMGNILYVASLMVRLYGCAAKRTAQMPSRAP